MRLPCRDKEHAQKITFDFAKLNVTSTFLFCIEKNTSASNIPYLTCNSLEFDQIEISLKKDELLS